MNIDEVAQRLNVQIEREGFETVGGYLLSHLGRVPTVGERFDVDGLNVEILDAERRRINKVGCDHRGHRPPRRTRAHHEFWCLGVLCVERSLT